MSEVAAWPASMDETAGETCQRCHGTTRPFFWLSSPELKVPALLCNTCNAEFWGSTAEPVYLEFGPANPDVDYGVPKPGAVSQ